MRPHTPLRLSLLYVLAALVLCTLADSRLGAKCKRPSVRKEWRTLSTKERTNWIDAVKCLAKLPHDKALKPLVRPSDIPPVNKAGSYYDDLVYMHMDLNHLIHFTGLFLPWHRWYIHVYEIALRTKCGFTGSSPYWDWTQDTSDFYRASILSNSNSKSGLGGWGDPSNDFQVPDGAFSSSSSFKLSYPSPHSLRRNFTLRPYVDFPFVGFVDPQLQANTTFTKREVKKMVNGFVGDFKGFHTYFEAFGGAHSSVHAILGGDLGGVCPAGNPPDCAGGSTFSANEPLFWMHHAMVDKVWYDWQRKNPANARAFVGGSVEHLANYTDYLKYPTGGPPWLTLKDTMPSDGLFPEPKISDVISTTSGDLCYVYA